MALADPSISSEEDSDEKVNSIEEKVSKLECIFSNKGIIALKEAVYENADKWKRLSIDIAVTGSAGAGKSSFINAFLGLPQDDKNAANTGVKETTEELKVYFNSKRPNLKLWDMPGVGTRKHRRQTYLDDVKFDKYDFFLILSRSRFTDEDKWLAEQIRERKKKFYFIRTNIDYDIRNDKRVKGQKHDANEVMKIITEDIKSNLMAADIKDPKIFLVDNLDPKTYEFGSVVLELKSYSEKLKKDALVLSLSNLTKKVFVEKKRLLKERIFEKAFAIACKYDSRGLQKKIFMEEIKFLGEQFDVHPETVCRNTDILSAETIKGLVASWDKDIPERLNSIPRLSRHEVLVHTIRGIFAKTGAREVEHSVRILTFCMSAFDELVDKFYKAAVNIYNQPTQENIVRSIYESQV